MIDKFVDEYRFLSNFWPAEVEFGGSKYPSVEHAYQAAKTWSELERVAIRRAKTPGQAKRLGRRVGMREDWDDVKISVMYELVRQKFMGSAELWQKLLDTWNHELVEGNTWGDTFWGVSGGVGQNHLGEILMLVRDELREMS